MPHSQHNSKEYCHQKSTRAAIKDKADDRQDGHDHKGDPTCEEVHSFSKHCVDRVATIELPRRDQIQSRHEKTYPRSVKERIPNAHRRIVSEHSAKNTHEQWIGERYVTRDM